MLQDIYIFESIKDAKERLSIHAGTFQYPETEKLVNENSIIKGSVGSNIYRALGLYDKRPSVVYGKWAIRNFADLNTKLKDCRSQTEYDSIIKGFTASLLIEWENETHEKLGYGPASKILNLLIKILQESNQFRINRIFPFQHVPWDAYTLRPLQNIINELADTNYLIKIPANASMSFVNTPHLYDILQNSISYLYSTLDHQVPRIYFDYFAWNDNHK